MDLPQTEGVKNHLVKEFKTNFIHQELASGSPLIHATTDQKLLLEVMSSPQFGNEQKKTSSNLSDSDEGPDGSPLLIKRASMGQRAEEE